MTSEAGPAAIFDAELDRAVQRIRHVEFGVACGGTTHRMRFDGECLRADHHDAEGEAILEVIGGTPPACVLTINALADATSMTLWNALATKEAADDPALEWPDHPLCTLPTEHLRVFLAQALSNEFSRGGAAVRDHIARLGLALLAAAPRPAEALRPMFQMSREFPRWNMGSGAWSDRELMLIGRWVEPPGDGSSPRLRGLPKDPIARRAIARFLASLLAGKPRVARSDVRQLLSPQLHDTRAVIALLTTEGLLASAGGAYELRTPDDDPPGRARRRSSGRRF